MSMALNFTERSTVRQNKTATGERINIPKLSPRRKRSQTGRRSREALFSVF
uniref:Uncharacterized protein n=1 Tax=Anguilla anguilla TaxID=7936 RepID=A0A0E9WAY7_ANGAN